jgi:hypothetical protein
MGKTGVILRANVPFTFEAGETVMPAGSYIVERHVLPNHVVIRNLHTGASVMMLVSPAPGYGPSQKAKLIFSNTSGRRRLEQVWSADFHGGDQLARGR